MVKYVKAWRAHQRALRMIYGSWEDAYERLQVMLNAMKVGNPGMHYEYLPIPNVELKAYMCSSVHSGGLLSVWRHSGT
jgi:hypothetical protein